MASGHTHDYGSMASAVLAAALEVRLGNDLTHTLAATLGAISGLYISPDLDMPQITRSEARLFRIPLVGLLFFIFWYPYSIIPHRSVFSHLPILGTVLRVLYLIAMGWIWATVIEGLLGFPYGKLGEPWKQLWASPMALAWIRGLALSDLSHWLLDGRPVRYPSRRRR